MNRPRTPRVTYFEPNMDMAINYNCLEFNNKFYNINISSISLDDIEDHVKLYKDKDINKVPDGIYIWLIATMKDGSTHLYFNKVYTVHEFGTKHQNIVNRIHKNLKEIHLAGELIKDSYEGLWYNFLSGTYMLDNIDVKNPFEDALDDFDDFVFEFTGLPLIYDNSGKTLIHPNRLILSHDDLNLFLKYGADIHSFKTEEECKRLGRYKLDLAKYKARLVTHNRQLERFPNMKFKFKEPIKPKGSKYEKIRRSSRLKP
jgi:hypothetical protein